MADTPLTPNPVPSNPGPANSSPAAGLEPAAVPVAEPTPVPAVTPTAVPPVPALPPQPAPEIASAPIPEPGPIVTPSEQTPAITSLQATTMPAEVLTAAPTPPPAPTPTPPSSTEPVPTTQPGIQPNLTGAAFTTNNPRIPYRGPKPTVLLVLDGWGIGPNNAGNAIARAHTPNMNRFWVSFPHTQLSASGEAVGLPRSEDGNTETGHLNIGAGSIVYQDLPRINMAIAEGSFNNNQAFLNTFAHIKQYNSTLHLMGLIGSGGVHSNIEHLYALLHLCKEQGIQKVFIHGFMDGRDSPPTSGINYIQQITEFCKQLGVGEIASLMGRYYAMDRDKRWERIEKAYNLLTLGAGACTPDPILVMQDQYNRNITDEFIEPISVCYPDGTPHQIQDNDGVIFFNYRVDRPRELTKAFVLPNFEQGLSAEGFDPYAIKYERSHLKQTVGGATFQRQKILNNLYFTTMTRYEEGLPVDVAFPPQFVKNPICKAFASHGLKQLRMAETEKEKFVTYYMNGQQDDIYPGEDRVILPSKGAKSYDQIPEMSAREIAAEMITRIRQKEYDVIICNFANADMVAHTGNLEATIKACEVLDEVVGQIVREVFAQDGVVLITADHGNAEELINNSTGEVDTEHSIYPVPFIIIGKKYMNKPTMLPTGILADVAPTMLSIMGISKPETMTGRALL